MSRLVLLGARKTPSYKIGQVYLSFYGWLCNPQVEVWYSLSSKAITWYFSAVCKYHIINLGYLPPHAHTQQQLSLLTFLYNKQL